MASQQTTHGPGGSSSDCEAYQPPPPPPQQQHQFYNQFYNQQNQHHQSNGSPYQNYDPRQMNYNNFHQGSHQQQYHPQWCPPRPYYNNSQADYAAHFPQQQHQQQQFYQQPDPQRPSWPPVERPPHAPLDSLQMLVKENGPVNGDKRPRPSDEGADGEGRKRRRKSDRPTRISNGSTQSTDEPPSTEPPSKEPPTEQPPPEQPPPVEPTPPVEEANPKEGLVETETPLEPPAVNGAAEEAASDRSTPLLEIRTDESNEAPLSQGEPSESQPPSTPTKPKNDDAPAVETTEPTPETPVVTPKKKGRPKGSKNKNKTVRKKKKGVEMVLDDDEDIGKKKNKKITKKLGNEGKKKVVAKATEPPPPEEKQLPKGPLVRVSGDKETVVNSGKSEEELGKKPRSCFNDTELRTKVAGMGFSSAMAQQYDAFTIDETWVCAFCKRGSHQYGLGDLFGPYFVQTAKKKKKFEVWVHESCCVWAPGVGLVGQRLIGLQEAIFSSADKECEVCKKKGAMIGCVKRGCERRIHFPCSENWYLDKENFVSCCPEHERIPRDPQTLLQKK
ncbi:uncharacterized protein CG5098 isoform X2 [Cloeon dipterum]|uniref:uncharacterized protein CG5098 isoform X2 n=1 Tax=Cloeon dipterum TaxID=197152 RepID=UPI00322044C1